MRITVIGRGNVGGGLAKRWRDAGHDVQELGREGGDASGADVLLLAVPGGAVPEALANVSGIEGKLTIDATNRMGMPPPEGFNSNAAYVKSVTGGPTAKAFNINFARLYDDIGNQRVKAGNFLSADDDAREVTEQLIRDAGYEPIYAGNLDVAGAQEDAIPFVFALGTNFGPFFYRFWKPGEL
jgi:8-hydroxy-5-deazaflavin:NADPH oxidoreductase